MNEEKFGKIENGMPEKLEPRPNEDYYNYFTGLVFQVLLGRKGRKFEPLPEMVLKDGDDETTKVKISEANEIISEINKLANGYIEEKKEAGGIEEILDACNKALDLLYPDSDERKKRLKEKFEEHQKLFNH
jgi:hypothetical protein